MKNSTKKILFYCRGFTLSEMIITLAIVIVLSVISVPIYKDYVWQAKMLEGYTLLKNLRNAHIKYYNEYGTFGNWQTLGRISYTSYHPVFNVDARGNKYYTWFLAGYSGNDVSFVDCAYMPGVSRLLTLIYNITAGTTYK